MLQSRQHANCELYSRFIFLVYYFCFIPFPQSKYVLALFQIYREKRRGQILHTRIKSWKNIS